MSRAASRAGEGWGLKDVIAESGSNEAAGPTSTSTSWRALAVSTMPCQRKGEPDSGMAATWRGDSAR